MAKRTRRPTRLEVLDREIETFLAKLAVEVGSAGTMAEARKETRKIYRFTNVPLRVLDGGRA